MNNIFSMNWIGRIAIGLVCLLVLAFGVFWLKSSELSDVRASLPTTIEEGEAPAELVDAVESLRDGLSAFSEIESKLGELAMTYHSNRYYTEATEVYSLLIDREPEEPRWHYLLADVYQSEMDFESYGKTLDRLSEIGPEYAPTLLALGNREMRKGELELAAQFYREAITLEPSALPAYGALKRVGAMGVKSSTLSPPEGLTLLEKTPDPWLDEVYGYSFDVGQLMVRADASVLRGDFTLGLMMLDRARSIAPNDWKVHVMRLNVFVKQGQVDQALSAYQAALASGADEGGALAEISGLLIAEGNASRVVSLAKEGIKRQPGNIDLYRLLARAYREIGELVLAEVNLRKALQIMPEAHDIEKELGILLWSRGKHSAAAAQFLKVVKHAPLDSVSRTYLAQYYVDRGEFSRAEPFVSEALRLDSSNKELLRLSGVFFVQYAREEAGRANWKEVVRLLERGAELSPLEFSFATLLVKALVGLERNHEAIELLRVIVREHPTRPEAFMTLADLLAQHNGAEEAIDCYRSAIEASRGRSAYEGLSEAAAVRLAQLVAEEG